MTLLVLIPILLAHILLLCLVNSVVPDAYMDEPFHVPQTQQYCKGRFHDWDPKITTFPGLYLFGVVWGHAGYQLQRLLPAALLDALGWQQGAPLLCSIGWLRGLNVALAAACTYVLWALLQEAETWRFDTPVAPPPQAIAQSQAQAAGGAVAYTADSALSSSNVSHVGAPSSGEAHSSSTTAASVPSRSSSSAHTLLFALVLAAYPVHWFFSFLYYTDVGALLFLLLCQLYCLRGQRYATAVAGAAAVLFRQTNAVWVAFILGAAVLRLAKAADMATPSAGVTAAVTAATSSKSKQPAVAIRRMTAAHSAGRLAPVSPHSGPVTSGRFAAADGPSSLQEELSETLRGAWQRRRLLARELWPVAMVPTAFALFVVVNGGITVGDRAAHAPVKHLPQLLYFAAFAATMSAPVHFAPGHTHQLMSVGLRQLRSRPVAMLASLSAAIAAAVAAVQRCSLVHPYLVADNRHYPFYVHRKILSRHPSIKYVLLPLYGYCWASLLCRLRLRQSRLWTLGYLACLAAALVPAWLLEFRYFTPGFFLLVIHSQQPTRLQLLAMGTMFVVINATTMYLFLARPYVWADGSTARFMW